MRKQRGVQRPRIPFYLFRYAQRASQLQETEVDAEQLHN